MNVALPISVLIRQASRYIANRLIGISDLPYNSTGKYILA